jgi:hypothetical protein
VRSHRNTDSNIVGVRSSGAGCAMEGITISEVSRPVAACDGCFIISDCRMSHSQQRNVPIRLVKPGSHPLRSRPTPRLVGSDRSLT